MDRSVNPFLIALTQTALFAHIYKPTSSLHGHTSPPAEHFLFVAHRQARSFQSCRGKKNMQKRALGEMGARQLQPL